MSKNKFIPSIFLLIAVFSCSKKDSLPDDIIVKKTMINLLVDIHYAEAKVNQAELPKDSSLVYYRYLEDSIFSNYGVDSAVYHESMLYYTKNIKHLDAIYEAVLDSLNLMSAREPIESNESFRK